MRRKKTTRKFRWKILTTRPAGKLPYLQNRGTFNFPSTFAVAAAAVFFFAFNSCSSERYVDDWPRNQWDSARERKTNGILNETWRTHTQRRNEDINYKVLILEGTAEWDKWFINCECRNQHDLLFSPLRKLDCLHGWGFSLQNVAANEDNQWID